MPEDMEKCFVANNEISNDVFKIRFEKAWNLLVLYHSALIFVDVIMGVVCEEVDKLNYQIDSFHDLMDMFWISAIINYGVVFMLNLCISQPCALLASGFSIHDHTYWDICINLTALDL